MGANTNPALENGFCTTGTKEDISETFKLLGVTPENPIINGYVINKIFNMIFENLNHIKKKGFAFWQPDSYYEATENNMDICRRNNQIYFCIETHNETGEEPKTPETNPDYWTLLYDLDKPLFNELNQLQIAISNITPIGSITMVPSIIPLVGTLECNGVLLSRTTYSKLWAFAQNSGVLIKEAEWASRTGCFSSGDGSTTFRIPDLRGVFPRGWDNSKGIDASRIFGSIQDSQNKTHTHAATSDTQGNHAHSAWTDISGEHIHGLKSRIIYEGAGSNRAVDPVSGNEITSTTESAGAHGHNIGVANAGAHAHNINVSNSGGNETRPINIALMFCIKY